MMHKSGDYLYDEIMNLPTFVHHNPLPMIY